MARDGRSGAPPPRRPALVAVALLAAAALPLTGAIYEDRVGQLDWHREQLGAISAAVYEPKRAYVATRAGLVAALASRTGVIEWRRALPAGEEAEALALHAGARALLAVSARGKMVRAWAADDGALLWDAITYSDAGAVAAPAAPAGEPADAPACDIVVVAPSLAPGGAAALLEGAGGAGARAAGAVVVLSNNALHVFDAATGQLAGQWFPEPEDVPALAAAIPAGAHVTLTKLRLLPSAAAADATAALSRVVASGYAALPGYAALSVVLTVTLDTALLDGSGAAAAVTVAAAAPAARVRAASVALAEHASGAADGGALALVALDANGGALHTFALAADGTALRALASAPLAPLLGVAGVRTAAAVSAVVMPNSGARLLELTAADVGDAPGARVAVTLGANGALARVAACAAGPEGGAGVASPCALGAFASGAIPGSAAAGARVFVARVARGGGDASGVRVGVLELGADDCVGGGSAASCLGADGAAASGGGSVSTGGEGGEVAPLVADEHGAARRVFPQLFERKDGSLGYRALVVTTTDAAAMVQPGRVIWLRDESLADVRRVEFVDAPSTAALAAATADVDLTHLTFRSRLGLQLAHLRAALFVSLPFGAPLAPTDGGGSATDGGGGGGAAVNTGDDPSLAAVSAGGRAASAWARSIDTFGFHQLALCVTRSGKLVALELATGLPLWSRAMLRAPPPPPSAAAAFAEGAGLLGGADGDDDDAMPPARPASGGASRPAPFLLAVTRRAAGSPGPELVALLPDEVGGGATTCVTFINAHSGEDGDAASSGGGADDDQALPASYTLPARVASLMQLDSWDEDGRRITLAIEAVADADLAADAEVPAPRVWLLPPTRAAAKEFEALLASGGGDGDDAVDGYSASLTPSVHFHRVDAARGTLDCFKVAPRAAQPNARPADGRARDHYVAALLAAVAFPTAVERIVAVGYGTPRETVNVPAQILGDDSLLLKYLNPNLAVVITEATGLPLLGPAGWRVSGASSSSSSSVAATTAVAAAPRVEDKDAPTLFVTLVDVVAGRVVHRVTHAGARAPARVVQSENWVVYTFWNARAHRTELAAISLYEGMVERHGLNPFRPPAPEHARGAVFSSLGARAPVALQRTFVLPRAVSALGVTVTKRGIASKHFLAATSAGQIIALDRRQLDPRRPAPPEPGTAKKGKDGRTDAERAEGLEAYSPYLNPHPLHTLSHNRTLLGVAALHAAPTTLESTSLVLVTGVDLFAAHAAPSKRFDVLADDFKFALLILLVSGLALALVLVRHAVKKKKLESAWA